MEQNILYIDKYILHFSIKCDRMGNLIDLENCNVKYFLDKYLAETIELPKENYFDKEPNIKIYYNVYFDRENNLLYIHNAFLNLLINYLSYFRIITKIKEHHIKLSNKKISIKFKKGVKDKDNQTDIINWLVKFNEPIRCLPLQTGDGKTYCSIRFISEMKYISLLIIPAYLQGEWLTEINKFLNIKKRYIYIIQGSKTILDLEKIKKPKFKIYITTTQTLSSFINNYGRTKLKQIFDKLNINIKIVDEVHLNFRQVLKIDLVLNIPINLYLSATFYKTDDKGNKIFQTIFQNKYKYKKPPYRKYTNITEYIYHNIGYIPEKAIRTIKGYSEIKYEKFLIKHPSMLKYFVKNVLFRALEDKYLNTYKKGEKCLIIVGYKLFGKHIESELIKYFNDILSNYKIGCYFYEDTKVYRDSLDIIISTIQSSGTGSNIKDLQACLLVDNFKAKGYLVQSLGRLRERKTETEFAYFQNNNLKTHRYYRWVRIKLLKPLSKSFTTINIY